MNNLVKIFCPALELIGNCFLRRPCTRLSTTTRTFAKFSSRNGKDLLPAVEHLGNDYPHSICSVEVFYSTAKALYHKLRLFCLGLQHSTFSTLELFLNVFSLALELFWVNISRTLLDVL
jgi:hypothetical protein